MLIDQDSSTASDDTFSRAMGLSRDTSSVSFDKEKKIACSHSRLSVSGAAKSCYNPRETNTLPIYLSDSDWQGQVYDMSGEASWFERVLAVDKSGDEIGALDLMFDEVDKLLRRGDFAKVDHWIGTLEPDDLSANLIVGTLSITRQASEHLSKRESFFLSAWVSIERRGRSAERLISKLLGRRYARGPSNSPATFR